MSDRDAESGADHDARCEREYTDNGFVFIDCLCSLRSAKADAWDEGYERRGDAMAAFGKSAPFHLTPPNPYRVTAPVTADR